MSTKVKTREWDSVEYLRNEGDIRLYLEAAMEEAPDDAAYMAAVLGDVARARNIAELARTTGIARETLYKTLRGEGNPTMATISKLANALGFRLGLIPMPSEASTPKTARPRAQAAKATAKPAKPRKVA